MPPGWKENSHKRNIIDSVFRNVQSSVIGQTKIVFFALNYDDPGYPVIVNGKEPKRYNTNAVYSIIDMSFEKGSRVDVPSGIIRPSLADTRNAFFDDPFNGSVRVNMDGDVDFTFTLPENISIENFKLHWSTFMPLHLKYQPKPPKGAPQQTFAKNTYKFFIYNNSISKWEDMDNEFDSSGKASSYINNKRELKVRANATIDRSGPEGELLGLPELEISGVVK